VLAALIRLDIIHTFPGLGLFGVVASVGLGVGQTLVQRYMVESKPAEENLAEYVRVPDYTKNLGFIHDTVAHT
jgi:hypothetical protein